MPLALDTRVVKDRVGLPDINSHALNHFAMLLVGRAGGWGGDCIYAPALLWD